MADGIFKDRIYGYRVEYGLTQEQLAERIGLSKQTISTWEKGRNEPRFRDARVYAAKMGVSVEWLMGLDVPEYEGDNPEVVALAEGAEGVGDTIKEAPRKEIRGKAYPVLESQQALSVLEVKLKAMELLKGGKITEETFNRIIGKD